MLEKFCKLIVRKKSALFFVQLLCQDQLAFRFGRPKSLNLNDSQCLFSELPRLFPLMEFLPLRATCKQFSKTVAFQKLLTVKWPKPALAAARQKHLSAEDLLTFPHVKGGIATKREFYGFCCPEDRRKFNRFCCNIISPRPTRFFISKVDDSYETCTKPDFIVHGVKEVGAASSPSFGASDTGQH